MSDDKKKIEMTDEEARMLLLDMDQTPGEFTPEILETPVEPENSETSSLTQSDTATTSDDSIHQINAIGEVPEWESNEFGSDPEMMNDFHTNTGELLQNLDENVLKLEHDPTNKETIEEIFRAAHTFKGAAGMFGFRAIERVMHRMENFFDQVRKGRLVPNSATIDAVFKGMDCLRALLEAVKTGVPSGIKTAPIVYALGQIAEGKSVDLKKPPAEGAPENQPNLTKPPSPSIQKLSEGSSSPAPENEGKLNQQKKEASTIRVDLERLDVLVNLIGELVIDRTRLISIEEELTKGSKTEIGTSMSEVVQLFGRHMNEIQEIIMKIRMVPIGNAFNKYPRIIRDLARSLGKEINLVIEGESTELDKTLVEQIADPLVHLIRNACDHGIESQQDRVSAGKNPAGQVLLKAHQEGNHIVITIQDDGKGMDIDRIRQKGIERGLIASDATLSDTDILNLIFEPGFSTVDAVTTVSGRGVGMDVVKKQIAKLKGLVNINSAKGAGSTITIQLPLTLAIMQSLLIEIHREIFAIPLSSVVESLRIQQSDIKRVGDSEVIMLRDRALPLISLSNALDLAKKEEDFWYPLASRSPEVPQYARRVRQFVVVVGTAERRFGIVVDRLLHQQEIVVKNVGKILGNVPCIAGGAVMGNGEVVLVLDIQELDHSLRFKKKSLLAA